MLSQLVTQMAKQESVIEQLNAAGDSLRNEEDQRMRKRLMRTLGFCAASADLAAKLRTSSATTAKRALLKSPSFIDDL